MDGDGMCRKETKMRTTQSDENIVSSGAIRDDLKLVLDAR